MTHGRRTIFLHQPSNCPKLAYRNLSQISNKRSSKLDTCSEFSSIGSWSRLIFDTLSIRHGVESPQKTRRWEVTKPWAFLKWPSCSWRSIVPLPSSSISAKTSAFAGWNMTSSTNFNKTAPQERLEKNMLLFLWWTRKWGFLLNSKFHQISSATRCDYKHNRNEHLPRVVPSRDLHHFGRKLPHLSYCQYRYPLGEKDVGVSSFK